MTTARAMELHTDSQMAWATFGGVDNADPFHCDNALAQEDFVLQLRLPKLTSNKAPQPVYHIRVSLFDIVSSSESKRPVVSHAGSAMIAVGLPGCPRATYHAVHSSAAHDFVFPAVPERNPSIPTYQLTPAASDSVEWIDCATQATGRTIRITGLPFQYRAWDVSPEYNVLARDLTRRASKNISSLGLTGEQMGFLRTSEKRVGFQGFPLTALVGIREMNAVQYSVAHLAGLAQLAATLTGFSLRIFYRQCRAANMTLHRGCLSLRDLCNPASPVVDTLLSLACVMVGSFGFSSGYEAEAQDDTSQSFSKLGRVSDCEDMAIACCGGFAALKMYAAHKFEHNKFPEIELKDDLCLLDLVAYCLEMYYEEASLACGFVDLSTSRPDLKKLPDGQLSDQRSGHAWCVIRVKPGMHLPPRTRAQCGCAPASARVTIIESTTPTVPVVGPAVRDFEGDLETYNSAVVEAQQLFNTVLDLRVSRETASVVGQNNEEGLGMASFLNIERYQSVAYEGNARRTFALAEDGRVGISLKQLCGSEKGLYRKYLNPSQTIRDEYNLLFAPFELDHVPIDTDGYRAAEKLIDRADVAASISLTYPLTESLRDVRQSTAFTLDLAPPGLVRAAHAQTGYLGEADVPTIIRVPTGDLVVLPGSA